MAASRQRQVPPRVERGGVAFPFKPMHWVTMARKSVKKPRIRREALSADRIAAEALALVDAEGLEGFSFRVLAARLGCEAMSLYHYFPGKAHLFDAMAALYLAEMAPVPNSLPWPEQLRATCWEFRAAALRHPGFFQFMSIYRLNSRAGLAFLNSILAIFEATGLDDEARARHFRVIGYFVTGAALDEALGYAKGPSAAEPVPSDEAARDFPAIMKAGRFFGTEGHARTFAQGVDTLIAAIVREADRRKA